MKSYFKITRPLLDAALVDLSRPHDFAYERVGFLTCRFALTVRQHLLVLADAFHPVADEDYIEDERYGALIGGAAFRKALQLAYSKKVGLFHVHLHDHLGDPLPSSIDLRETARFVPDFFNVRNDVPHGAIIFSRDSISGRIWSPLTLKPLRIHQFNIVGAPMRWLDGV